jgi:hypothetical protein
MPNPNKIAPVDLNSVLFWTAQVIDRAYSRKWAANFLLCKAPTWPGAMLRSVKYVIAAEGRGGSPKELR